MKKRLRNKEDVLFRRYVEKLYRISLRRYLSVADSIDLPESFHQEMSEIIDRWSAVKAEEDYVWIHSKLEWFIRRLENME